MMPLQDKEIERLNKVYGNIMAGAKVTMFGEGWGQQKVPPAAHERYPSCSRVYLIVGRPLCHCAEGRGSFVDANTVKVRASSC